MVRGRKWLRPIASSAEHGMRGELTRTVQYLVAVQSPFIPSTHLRRRAKAGVMSVRHQTLLVSVIGTAATFCWANGALAQDAAVFVGTWALSIDKTEPAKDKVIEDAEGTGAGRTMATGMGGRGASRRTGDVAGGSGSGGGGARSGSGGGSGGGRSNVRLIFGGMMMASKTLKVTQADSIITIEDEDGPIFVNLHADKTLEETLTNQTVLKTKVQWKKNELVVERSHETDGSARMIMRIDPRNPKVLVVDFHYEHKRQRRTIDQRRVYEASM
jgi:hypothetical protein